jgi:hypothetical protein
MVDYEGMYAIICGAASDSLDILLKKCDEKDIEAVCCILQCALLKAENIYTETTQANE